MGGETSASRGARPQADTESGASGGRRGFCKEKGAGVTETLLEGPKSRCRSRAQKDSPRPRVGLKRMRQVRIYSER